MLGSKLPWRAAIPVIAALLFSASVALAANPDDVSEKGGVGVEPVGADDREVGAVLLRDAVQSAGGLEIYPDGDGYVVVVPKGVALPVSTWTDLDLDFPVRVAEVDVTPADVDAVKARIIEIASSRAGKDDGWQVWFDPERGLIIVEGPDNEKLRSSLMKEFATKILYIENSDGGLERLADRDHDTQPYWGGDKITDNWVFPDLGLRCTSGFAVKKPDGTKYMATAGHCKNLNEGFWTMGSQVYGNVRFRAAFPATDSELIGDQTYAGAIWLGGLCCAWHNVTGGGNPLVNSTYCTGGSFSLEHCDRVAEAVDVQACDAQNQCTNHLVRFTNGNTLQPGDSGGPFYFKSTATCVYARGTIVGKNGAGKGFAQLWNTVLNSFGVSTVQANC